MFWWRDVNSNVFSVIVLDRHAAMQLRIEWFFIFSLVVQRIMEHNQLAKKIWATYQMTYICDLILIIALIHISVMSDTDWICFKDTDGTVEYLHVHVAIHKVLHLASVADDIRVAGVYSAITFWVNLWCWIWLLLIVPFWCRVIRI